MKKFTRLLSLITILAFATTTAWAVDVQIGSGTTTTTSVPISSCWNFNYTQQIYLATEFENAGGGVGPITKIRFYYVEAGTTYANWADWTIYLGNTEKNSFASTTDWIPLTEITEVFSGDIPTPVPGSWIEIVLDTPFDYTGGNLVVAVDENSPGYSCTAKWRSFNVGSERSIFYRSDPNNPDPASPPTASFTGSALAQVQFDMAAFVSTLPPNCALNVSPAPEATEVLETATLNWLSGGGLPEGYKLYFGTDNPPTNIVNGDDLGDVYEYIPAALDYGTTYYWQVVAYNANGDAEACDVWSFTTREEPGTLSGTVTDQDSGLPIEGAMVMAEGEAGFGLAETDDQGYYEMELPPGDYDVICEAAGYETGGVIVTFMITILPGQMTPLNFTLAPIIGADCANPILIDAFPYEDLGQSNCGMGNTYSETCLESYDGGEDIFYSFTLTETTTLNITFDPKTSTWTGIAVFDECPPPVSECIAKVTNSSASIRTIQNLVLDAGTYYIMIDTYPAPNCIPEFDLMIEEVALPGSDCTNPLMIGALPFEDIGQTNCGMGDNYNETCLGDYDSGEDIFYEFTLDYLSLLNITLDPKETNYVGMALFDACPPTETCIATASNGYDGGVFSFGNLELEAGTYFLMIDTWASPDCIPEFDLMIEDVPFPDGCKYTVELYDSDGDGWDGNTLTVNVNGSPVLDQVTLASGYGPAIFEFYAETDDLIEFIVGTDTYGENSFYVYDSNDELVFEDGPYPVGGTILADCGDCQYSVALYDSYGDGWNGGELDVLVDGVPVLEGLTIVDGAGPEEFFFTVFTGSVIDFDYTSGSYAGENYYYAYDANGLEVFSSGLGSSTPGDGQITGNCEAETGTLAGVITDGISGLPIEGATVVANDGLVDYIAETDDTGAYEMVLVTGEYDVIATAPGYQPSEPLDVIITINANLITPLNLGLLPLYGASCSNPVLIAALPYQDIGQTNCGLGNVYDQTCLGGYDGGDDIIYQFTIDETMAMNIIMDPKTTSWTGMAIFDGCPDIGNCIQSVTSSSADTLRLEGVLLVAGTYYLMIDTWPSPYCIPEFDLHIELLIPGMISGLVTDIDTGDPIGGVDIVAEPGGFSAFTNVLGEYQMEAYAGMYDLTFTHPEYFELLVDSVDVVAEQTTFLDAEMLILPMPDCPDLLYPADNAINILPNGLTFSWASAGIVPVDGYQFWLYDYSRNVWVEQGKDLGNVTEYTMDLKWGTYYGLQLRPYNIAGVNDNCLPFSFYTSYKGSIDGMIVDAVSELPIEGVMIEVEELSPNAGNTWSLTSAVDGSWYLDWADDLEGGMYAISYTKYGYEDMFVGNFEVLPNVVTPANVSMMPVTPYALPFIETWDSESLATQQWSAEAANWGVYAFEGMPVPTARFNWTPTAYDYQIMLESYYLDATNETNVFVQFDLYLDNYSLNTIEEMIFQVYDGTQWNDVDVFDNQSGDIEWTSFTYDISTLAAGKQIKIGFLAQGEYSLNIDGWYIDNITVASTFLQVDPDKVADILFPAEVSVQSFDIVNIGTMPIEWEIDELALPAWATVNLANGTLAGGASQAIEVTFDATIAGTGTFSDVLMISGDAGIYTAELALELEVLDANGQKIMIPGPGEWGYVSTYIDMNAKMTMYEAFADVLNEMEILVGKTGIFWPGMSVNTLGDYNTYEGYKMKMNEVGALAFLGDMVEDQTVSFPAGTFIIPVLTDLAVPAATIFDGQPLEFAFGLDGSIYWPAGGITTLETLYPGYGYLVRFSDAATLDFDVQLPKADPAANTPPNFANATSWNDVYKTGDFHMVGINAEAVAQLEAGDFVGVFNSDGLCTGMTYYNGKDQTLAIPVFANDNTTPEINGMVSDEALNFRIYRDNEEIAVEVAYDYNMPNYDGMFVNNGLSVINSLKVGATGLSDNPESSISVYPNPSDGMFNIEGVDTALEMMVSNAQGQLIIKQGIADSYQLDLTSQPAGVYYIRLVGEQGVKLIKVIKQ